MKINIIRTSTALLIRPFIKLIPKSSGFVILTFHNIPHDQMFWFETVIKLIYEHFEFAKPIDFYNYKDRTNFKKTKILLTFDDGFYSNRVLAEKILKKYDVKGIFFITEKFIGLNHKESLLFAQDNFYPNSQISDNQSGTYNAMSVEDLRWLIKNGHMTCFQKLSG